MTVSWRDNYSPFRKLLMKVTLMVSSQGALLISYVVGFLAWSSFPFFFFITNLVRVYSQYFLTIIRFLVSSGIRIGLEFYLSGFLFQRQFWLEEWGVVIISDHFFSSRVEIWGWAIVCFCETISIVSLSHSCQITN